MYIVVHYIIGGGRLYQVNGGLYNTEVQNEYRKAQRNCQQTSNGKYSSFQEE